MGTYHLPVLLQPTIEALAVHPDGIYVDGTAGGGGHSFEIASRLTTGHLYSLDRDPDAIAEAGKRLAVCLLRWYTPISPRWTRSWQNTVWKA